MKRKIAGKGLKLAIKMKKEKEKNEPENYWPIKVPKWHLFALLKEKVITKR